jgi:hypothetical protein
MAHPAARKEKLVELLVILLLVFIAVSLAANRWGHDSRDGIDSLEWVRREHY